MTGSMTAAGAPGPSRAEGALRACSTASGRALGGRLAGGTGALCEAGATAERLGCRHRCVLSGRWSGVWAAWVSGHDRPAEPAPSSGCSHLRARPAPAVLPRRGRRICGSLGPQPPLRPSLEVWGQGWTPPWCDLIKMVTVRHLRRR